MRTLFLLIVTGTIYSQDRVVNYLAFDQISLFDISVSKDSTRVIQYEIEDFNYSEKYFSYPNLESFRKDHYIDEEETFMKVDSLSNDFDLGIGQVFSIDSHSQIKFEVKPQNILQVHYPLGQEVPDALNGCALRYKRIKTTNYSVYLFLDCEELGTTSLLYMNTGGSLFTDAQELLWDLDAPRIQAATFIESEFKKDNRCFPIVGGLEIFKKDGKSGIFDKLNQRIFLLPEFDKIFLKDIIIVEKKGFYGAYDYALSQILEIDNKIIETSHNNRFRTIFIDKTNRIGVVNLFGNKFYKKELKSEKDKDKNFDYVIEIIDSAYYLRRPMKNNLKNQYLSILGSKNEYKEFYFNSKNRSYSYGSLLFIFGLRTDGLYDAFGFINYSYPTGVLVHKIERDLEDYKLIPRYPPYGNWERVILQKDKYEHPILASEISKKRYKTINSYFEGYYHFILPDGKMGWVDENGREYFDN